MRNLVLRSLLAAVATLGLAQAASAEPIEVAEVKLGRPVNFEQDVLPILKKNCIACHNQADAESNLVVETPASILKGGSLGPAVVAKNSGESLLLKVAAHQAEPIMPPEDNDVNASNLTPRELGILKAWIDEGATGTVTGSSAPLDWQPLPPGVNPVFAVAISPDGQFIAAGRANQIFIYHVPSGQTVGRLTDPALLESGLYKKAGVAHRDIVQALAFSPDGNTLASGGYQTVKLWQRPHNVQLQTIAQGSKTGVFALSADGKLAAVGSGNDIAVIDRASGKVSKTLKGHSGPVRSVAFAKGSEQLVSGSDDKTLRVWTLADGKELLQIATAEPAIAVTAFGEGTEVAAASGNNIDIWSIVPPEKPAEEKKDEEKKEGEAEAPKPIRTMTGHSKPVVVLKTLANAPTMVISGSEDGTLRHWDASKGSAVRTFSHGGPVTDVAATSDGARFASVGADNICKLWTAANGQTIATLQGDYRFDIDVAKQNAALALAKSQLTAATKALEAAEKDAPPKAEAAKKAAEALAAADKTLKEKTAPYDKALADKTAAEKALAAAEELVKKATADVEKATAALDKDKENKKLADDKAAADKALAEAKAKFTEADNKLKATAKPLADTEKAKQEAQTAYDTAAKAKENADVEAKRAADAIPTAKTAVAESEKEQKSVEDALAAATEKATGSRKPLASVAFSPDNTRLAVGGDDQLIHLYDGTTGQALDILAGNSAAVSDLQFAADGALVSNAADGKIIAWNVSPEWGLARTIGGDSTAFIDRVISLAFNPQGNLLATGGGDPSRSGELKIWNVDDGSLVKDFPEAHSDTIFGIEFSPKGNMIATGAADKFVKIFDVATGKFVRSFEGHTHHVLGVTWKFDSSVLVSAGADNVLKIWDVETGEQKRTIQGFNKQMTSVEFLGATSNVVAGSGDMRVHVRNADNGGAVRTLTGPTDYVYCTDSTWDGNTIVASGQDSVIRVWNAANGAVVATFEPPATEDAATEQTAAK